MTVIHIHARDIVQYDAVGNFCRQSAQLFAQQGHEVRLWAENTNIDFPPHPVEQRSYFASVLAADDVIFYNHSIFDPMLDELLALPHRKIGYFHNITPPELIDPADAETIRNCRLGLDQSGKLAACNVLLANSAFTAQTLIEAMTPGDAVKWRDSIGICPPLVGADRWHDIVANRVPNDAPSADLNLLFVGRLVPHKGVESVLALADHLAAECASLLLVIVGGPAEGAHVESLKARAAEIRDRRSDLKISFLHGISDGELKALYARADVMLIQSRHEGFCIPALDALAFDMPVFSSPLPAVKEVLGTASLEIAADDPAHGAREILAFMKDGERRSEHGRLRKRRFEEWRRLADGRVLLEAISTLKVS